MANRPSRRGNSSPPTTQRQRRLIEDDAFPFESLSDIAEIESWRKEIYRPIYHIHKWWAQRLGSVFRAAILASVLPPDASLLERFYQPVDLRGLVVFDPFMGSGTTVGEAVKLGCLAIGRDINPIAYHSVRIALGDLDRGELQAAFDHLERTVGRDLLELYRSYDADGRPCDVLYFFWVKYVGCPGCGQGVDLFPSYVFAKHAYVRRNPGVQIVCPGCGTVFAGRYDQATARCPGCDGSFDPHTGPAHNAHAVCSRCAVEFPIAHTIRRTGNPPLHRVYAKLVLTATGQKRYLPATDFDRTTFEAARRRLDSEGIVSPLGELEPGYNTRQALNYGYRSWRDFFNERQLLALGLLARAIRDLPTKVREPLAVVFSGVLEFNNLFASYKGEGTGAVRHMFAHHILKPERTPIEANVWGLPQSSGAFSTLFRSRLLRALEYREAPFEVGISRRDGRRKGCKVYGASEAMRPRIIEGWPPNAEGPGLAVSCGDSAVSGLPSASVDLVVTDPPFFDNVHYSELADFFFAWQCQLLDNPNSLTTTRQTHEVQDTDSAAFARKLAAVFRECCRVLKEAGFLVFSYHHSRDDGWLSVARAIAEAGFSPVEAQPVKAEMSVATPKAQARDPIDIDVLFVCAKTESDIRPAVTPLTARASAEARATAQATRFARAGRRLSRNDVKVLLMSRLLVELSAGRSPEELLRELGNEVSQISSLIDLVRASHIASLVPRDQHQSQQLSLELPE